MKHLLNAVFLILITAGCYAQNNDSLIADSNNLFAFKLYNEVKSEVPGQNIFFSPFSISTALAMTYAGAKGETEKQMSQTMNFSLKQDSFHTGFHHLTGDIEKDTTNGTQLFIANSLWAQKEFKFLKAFIDLVETNYNPILKNVDFTNNIAREDARKELNKWVEQKTNDKINELLKQGDIDASTKLILVNAIYFKAAWDVVFDKSRTENKTFYLHSNDSIQVPIMHKSGDLMYYENADMQVVDIPYKEDKLSMMIFLPWEKEGFEKMENLLNKRLYTQIIDSLGKENVDLSIPQFTTTFDFKLDKALPVMGMPLAFSGKADFSGMTGRKDLYISHVIHKAFINVNESGTEAAAATVVIMRLTSRRMETSNTKIFNANHPFIFLIKDNTTGSILFMGKTMNPEKD